MHPARRTSTIAAAVLALAVLATACGSSAKTTTATTPAQGGVTTGVANGVSSTTTGPGTTMTPSGDTFCRAATAMNKAAVQNIATGHFTPDQVRRLSQQSQTALADLLKTAPSSLKADLQSMSTLTDAFWALVARAGYDLTKIPATDMATLATPQLIAAGARVNAYMHRQCGITVAGATGR